MKEPLQFQDGGIPGSSPIAGAGIRGPSGSMAGALGRLADYAELAKLRLSLLVLVVVGAGYCLGSTGEINGGELLAAVFGTAGVAFAANALNQLIEREYDRRMHRTADRPLAAGRMQPMDALLFSVVSAAMGLGILSIFTNALAAFLAAATLVCYVAVYTPLKRMTAFNTHVGAVVGAIPPLIGFAAARGELTGIAWSLFGILFTWQLPHFLSIAWLYREDYFRGGYRMLSTVDPTGRRAGRQAVFFSILLWGASLMPFVLETGSEVYGWGASGLGAMMLVAAWGMSRKLSQERARLLLWASLAYLPALMALLLTCRAG